MPKDSLRDTEVPDIDEIDGGEGKPGNPEARDECRLGNFYTESMLYEYAIDAYKRAIKFDSDYATAHHNLGAVYYKMGLFDEAQDEIKHAIKIRQDVPLFHYTLGLILKDDKKIPECIESFSKAISLSPDYIEAYYRRGIAYSYINELEKSCADMEKVVTLDPEFRDGLYNLGVVYILLKRWDKALEVFQRQIALKPEDPDAFYYMAVMYIESGKDIEKALENLQRVVLLDPSHLKARFELALLYARQRYRDSAQRQAAIEQLNAVVEMYEELEDFDRIHDAFFLLGSIYDDEPADSDLAITAYERGLELANWSAEAHNNLAVLYSQKGMIDKAVREFREAIRHDPDFGSPYHNLAKIYFYQRNEEIIKDFQYWIKELPEMSAKILFNLSLALMDVGRAEACESIYSKAHKTKNLMGVAGSKLRRVCRETDDEQGEKLMEILSDQEKCYNEMVELLGALKQEDLVLDMVDINATVKSVVSQMDFKFSGQTEGDKIILGNVVCHMNLEEGLPTVKGDARKLKEAFSNVIINAIEAMDKGGSLEISTEYSDSTSEVKIIFRDTGRGIPLKDLDNIFKPGYTTKELGSGFGLSIANRIIQEHKGSISISSAEGKGTSVDIHLPVNLELAPVQKSLRMRPVIYEDPSKLISTEVDRIFGA